MNRKLMIGSALAVLMLVAISFASGFSSGTTNAGKKDSPLYMIRTKIYLGEKIGRILEEVKTRFIGDRISLFSCLLNFEDRVLAPCSLISSVPASCCPVSICNQKLGCASIDNSYDITMCGDICFK